MVDPAIVYSNCKTVIKLTGSLTARLIEEGVQLPEIAGCVHCDISVHE